MDDKNDSDDEITIDLGKITNFFKRKKKSKTEPKIIDKSEEIKEEEKPTEELKKEEEKKEVVQEAKEQHEPEKKVEVKEEEKTELKKESNHEKHLEKNSLEKKETIENKKTIEKESEEIKINEKLKENNNEKVTSEDDDEISIDFGKIKSFFKSKKEEAKVSENKDDDEKNIDAKKSGISETSDDEISIDFKKIKNIFKFSKEEKQDDDNISVDWKKFSNFFINHKALFLILIPLLLSIFLRVQPAYLPITDTWATDAVVNNVRSQVSGQINQQYPNLPDQNKNVLIDNEVQKVLNENKDQISQQIQATSQNFKSRLRDDSGQTYLLAIDPYFWLRHSKNIIENGHPGDEIRDGNPWDNHMFAPEGRGVPFDVFHAYFEAFMFKIMSFFNKGIGLMTVAFYIPVLISALSVIPAFFIARKIGGNFGGFIAALIISFHPSFLTRTVGGFSDTDAYNVMFPLFIAWIFLEALDSKSKYKLIVLTAIDAFLVGLYSFTWGGWWYIFDFILLTTIAYIAYYSFVHKKELLSGLKNFVNQRAIKNSLIFIVLFIILSGIFVSIFTTFGVYQNFYKNPLGFARLKEVGITTVWPNVFTTVAEQNPASLDSVINQIGFGKSFFLLISLMGIFLTLTSKEFKKKWFVLGAIVWYSIIFFMNVQNLNVFLLLISIPIIIRLAIALYELDTEIDLKYAIFLILWTLATIYASTKGIRFMLLLVPAFGLGFGIAAGHIYRFTSNMITKSLHVNKYISKTIIIIVIILLLIGPYRSAANIAKNEIPSMNDAWWISLQRIKEDSQPDAIINSWWDFGHWFKYVADRAVTFDGTSQNTPQAHWIGNVLLTDDEDTAIGILRMLDCSGYIGGTRAFEKIMEITKDHARTIDILYEIIPENKEDAGKILENYVEKDQIENILEDTHCEPPENYFITSEDMVGKSGVWAHFGSWDFDRALIYNTLKKKEFSDDISKSSTFLQERFNFSKNDAENLFFEVEGITDSQQANNWIAPWPGYAGTIGCNRIDDEILICDNGMEFNLTSHEAFANAQQGIVHPKSVSFPTNEGIIVKEYNDSLVGISSGRNLGITLLKNGESYQALQLDSALSASMFTRLFWQEGIGLKHFKKFSDERTVFGSRVIVWKVDWEGKEINIIEEAVEEIVEEESLEEVDNVTENDTLETESDNNTEILSEETENIEDNVSVLDEGNLSDINNS